MGRDSGLALQQSGMGAVWWMCDVGLMGSRVVGWGERLGVDDIIAKVQRGGLVWRGHVSLEVRGGWVRSLGGGCAT